MCLTQISRPSYFCWFFFLFVVSPLYIVSCTCEPKATSASQQSYQQRLNFIWKIVALASHIVTHNDYANQARFVTSLSFSVCRRVNSFRLHQTIEARKCTIPLRTHFAMANGRRLTPTTIPTFFHIHTYHVYPLRMWPWRERARDFVLFFLNLFFIDFRQFTKSNRIPFCVWAHTQWNGQP